MTVPLGRGDLAQTAEIPHFGMDAPNAAHAVCRHIERNGSPALYAYADGSFAPELGRGAYAVVLAPLESPESPLATVAGRIPHCPSAPYAEIRAILAALQVTTPAPRVVIVNDCTRIPRAFPDAVARWTDHSFARLAHGDLWRTVQALYRPDAVTVERGDESILGIRIADRIAKLHTRRVRGTDRTVRDLVSQILEWKGADLALVALRPCGPPLPKADRPQPSTSATGPNRPGELAAPGRPSLSSVPPAETRLPSISGRIDPLSTATIDVTAP